MKAITSYFFSRLHHEKQKILPLFFSLLLASTVISILALMYAAQYDSYLRFAEEFSGEQHFVINESLNDTQLSALRDYPDIEKYWTNGEYTYIQVKNIKSVYAVSEAIAHNLGLERTGYGTYKISYNRQLLGLYGIKDPYTNGITALGQLVLMASAFVIMTMILFSVIIRGAYAALERSRRSELGLLRSIGTTPEQIRYLIYLELILICIPAILLGLIIGYTVQTLVFRFIFSPIINLICAGCVFLTAFISSFSLVKRTAHETIISIISGNVEVTDKSSYDRNSKKTAHLPIEKNPPRMLAWLFYRKNRGAYRLSAVALTLFFAVSISFFTVMAFLRADSYAQLERNVYNVSVLTGNMLPDEDTIEKLAELSCDYSAFEVNTCSVVSDGLIDSAGNTNVWIYNGQQMLHTLLYGVDETTYRAYLNAAGLSETTHGAILVNNSQGSTMNNENHAAAICGFPLADINRITLHARSPYDMENEQEVSLPIAAVSECYPEFDTVFSPYDMVIVLELDEFERIDGTLYGDQSMRSASILLNADDDVLGRIKEQVEEILDSSFEGSIYSITTKLDKMQRIDENLRSNEQFILIMVAFFGVLSLLNAANSIKASLESRRHELDLMWSIGFDQIDERKMFLWEASAYSLLPAVFSILIAALVGVFLKCFVMRMAAFGTVLKEFQWGGMCLSILSVVIVIFAVYLTPKATERHL